jgi:hypothetical protein
MRLSRDIIMQAMKALIYAYVCPSTVCPRKVVGLLSSGFIPLNQRFSTLWRTLGTGLFFSFCVVLEIEYRTKIFNNVTKFLNSDIYFINIKLL